MNNIEAVNADGHKWDVFVSCPSGEVVRPAMAVFQDPCSGMILSWRVDLGENKGSARMMETVRTAVPLDGAEGVA